jgi:hypothetical protein
VYAVKTIGDLSGRLAGQPWPAIPPGWVPAGTPDLPGMPPSPVPTTAPPSTRVDGPALLVGGLGGVALAAFGLWVWTKYRKTHR